jgi:hypothetical protein
MNRTKEERKVCTDMDVYRFSNRENKTSCEGAFFFEPEKFLLGNWHVMLC